MTEVPYVSRRFRVSRRATILALLGLVGLGAIAAVLFFTWGAPTSSFDGFVYVESNRLERNSVLAYRFAGSRLTLLDEYPTRGRGVVDFGVSGSLDADGQLIVDLERRLLFAVNQGSDTIAVFRIAKNGTLAAVPSSPFPANGQAPASLSVAGSFLIVNDKAHDPARDLVDAKPRYVVFRIGAGGQLTPVGRPFVVEAGSSPTQARAITPRFIVGSEESGPFRAFVLSPAGKLTQAPNSPLAPHGSIFPQRYFGARWAIGIVPHPDEPILYANQSSTAQLLVYSYDSSGRLTFVRAVRNPKADLPCWSAVTPDGRRLFTANAGNGTVTAFDLSRDPLNPRRLQTLPLKTAANPWGLALDPSGRTLFVVDPRAVTEAPKRRGNRLHALHVGDDGRLTEIGSSPVKLPVPQDKSSPVGIAVVPR